MVSPFVCVRVPYKDKDGRRRNGSSNASESSAGVFRPCSPKVRALGMGSASRVPSFLVSRQTFQGVFHDPTQTIDAVGNRIVASRLSAGRHRDRWRRWRGAGRLALRRQYEPGRRHIGAFFREVDLEPIAAGQSITVVWQESRSLSVTGRWKTKPPRRTTPRSSIRKRTAIAFKIGMVGFGRYLHPFGLHPARSETGGKSWNFGLVLPVSRFPL